MSRSNARIASGTSSSAVTDLNGTAAPPGSRSTSDDPSAARTDTVRYSPAGTHTSPRGVIEVESIQSASVGGVRRARRFAVQTSCALSRGVRATMSNCITLSGGKAIQPIHAPLGQTRTGAPLMVTIASPLPALPKMKLESRASTTSPGEG